VDERLSLLVTYGPVVGFVIAFLLALYYRGAAKRARRRADRARPLALAEARAERDVHRAEYAVEVRGLEQQLEAAKEQLAAARLAAARDNKLQFDLARALERAVQAETERDRLQRELADERSKLADIEQRLADRDKDIAFQTGRAADSDKQAEAAREEARVAAEALADAREALEAARREKTEAETRVEAVTSQITEIRSAQVSSEEVAALRASLAQSTEQQAAEKAQRLEAERRLADREHEFETHSDRLQRAEAAADEARAELARRDRAFADQAAALADAEEARDAARERLEAMLREGDHDRSSAASAKARIDLLSQELSDLRSARVSGDEVAELRRLLAEANTSLSDERDRRLEMETTVRRLQAAAGLTAAAVAAPVAEAAPTDPAAADLAADLERTRQSLADANNALASEKSRRMALESDVTRLEAQAREARASAEAEGEARRAADRAAPAAKVNGAGNGDDSFDRVAQAAAALSGATGVSHERAGSTAELDDLRHELERLRAENAALARNADGHGEMDRLETAVLRERLQDIAAEIAVVAAQTRANGALGDGEQLSAENDDPLGSPDREGPSLAARVRALRRRRAV